MVIARHDERITWFQNLICGGAAVVLSRSATSPLEVVKVLNQVGTRDSKEGLARTFTNVYRNEGIKAFWKGNWMTCLRLFPYSVMQFITFNYLVNILEDPYQGYLSSTGSMLTGSASTMIAMLAVYPCETIRTRLIVQHVKPSLAKYHGITHTFRTVWKEEGFLALYKGLSPSILGVIPFAGGSFLVYRWFDQLDQMFDQNDYSYHMQMLLGGGLASVFAQSLSYPFDTIRKKMQASSKYIPGHGGGDVKFKGMCSAFVQTVTANGFLGLWRGLSVSLLKVCAIDLEGVEWKVPVWVMFSFSTSQIVPNTCLMYLSFEHCKRVLLYYNGYTLSPWEDIPRDDVDQSLLPQEVYQTFLEKKK